MNGKNLLIGLSHINQQFIEESELDVIEPESKTRLSVSRHLLIAAIIGLMVILMGCAVGYLLSMKHILIGRQQTTQDVFAYDSESGQAIAYLGQETVVEDVLTLAGLQGSANYMAAQEWFDFKQAYDPDLSIYHSLVSSEQLPVFPGEYEAYQLYSQEMKNKLDEILKKYELRLIGKTIPFKTEELACQALGLEDIVNPGSDANIKLDYVGYQECGNLNMDFQFILPGDGGSGEQITRCHLYFMGKDAFTEDVIFLQDMDVWKEWTYTTASGADVLIFRSPSDWRGYLFCDMPHYTITLQFQSMTGQYSDDAAGNTHLEKEVMTDSQIERLADAINFSIAPRLAEDWESLAEQAADSGSSIDGYSMTLKSVKTDGCYAVITLGITAPEEVNLLEHNGFPLSLKHSNRWGFFEPAPEGDSNVSGGFAVEEDGDGKAWTQNVVLRYFAGAEQIRNGEHPFAQGHVWNIFWQDLYACYLDKKTNEPVEYPLVKGTWSIDVTFEAEMPEELELITEPIVSGASNGWDMEGNEVCQDTEITSFLLRPMSASIICDQTMGAPDFLAAGDGLAYVMLKDGSTIPLYGDNASAGVQNLRAESVIDFKQVDCVRLPDGTRLPIPQT